MPRRRRRSPTLRHVVGLVRKLVVKVAQDRPVVIRSIAVPRSSLNILVGRLDDRLGILWLVSVVVVCPDFRLESCFAQSWTNVFAGEQRSFVLVLVHGDMATTLAVQRLVLKGDGIDVSAKLLETLQVFNEVVGVRLV